MLYDKRWDKETELEYRGVTLSGFIAWLETMPADGWYDYNNPRRCAARQYMAYIGLTDVIGGFEQAGYWLNHIVSVTPNTFGGALARAKQLRDRS
jgi:hypothetical protein